MEHIDRWLQKVEAVKPFTEREAWTLFRLSAFGEAIGWTALISGIVYGKTTLPFHDFAVPIAGQVHGLLFLGYFGLLIATYTSLGWPRYKAMLALAAGVPPYGSLIFELWSSRARRRELNQTNRRIIVRAIIEREATLLMMQPSSNIDWVMIGGPIMRDETPEAALVRIVYELTGVQPELGALTGLKQFKRGGDLELECSYKIRNADAFSHLDCASILASNKTLDGFKFREPEHDTTTN